MVFDGAYHMGSFSGAVCTPSRHMIMSGRTVWHLPIAPQAMQKGLCPPNLEQQTIPAVFNRAGYATMRTCKQGNSYEAANKLFTVRHDATKRGGTAETGSAWHGDRVLDYLARARVGEGREALPHLLRLLASARRRATARRSCSRNTARSITPTRTRRRPRIRSSRRCRRTICPRIRFHHGHPGLRDEVAVSGVWERRDERTIRNELGREFACSENIDIQIGRVLAKLEAMGELDNTYIIYTADHGIAIGRHGLQGKQNLYQHTWRVPFIVKGPGIKPGSRVRGKHLPARRARHALRPRGHRRRRRPTKASASSPCSTGEKQTVRDVLYGVYNGGTKPGMRSVKQGDWKLIKYDVMDGGVRETQLFNLKENPDEFLAEHHDAKSPR